MIIAVLLFPLLPLLTVFEIIKRVIFFFVYPWAYVMHDWPRINFDWFDKFLWLALDDSIVRDSLTRVNKPLEYHAYGKRAPLGFITERLKDRPFKEFMRSWNWGAWRNSAINLRDALSVGPQVYPVWRITLIRQSVGRQSFYLIRRFKHFTLPYLEIWLGKFRLQCGWLSGGFWQVQARKYP